MAVAMPTFRTTKTIPTVKRSGGAGPSGRPTGTERQDGQRAGSRREVAQGARELLGLLHDDKPQQCCE